MSGKTSMGLDENIAGLLCYLLTWVTGIIFYLIEKENDFVKFHAKQSIVTFLPLTIILWIVGWIPFIGWILSPLLGLLILVLWIVLMIKAYHGERWKVPIFGDLVDQVFKK